jgi:hemolysin III
MSHEAKSYGRGEEIANVVTHSIGTALSVAGLVILLFLTLSHPDRYCLVSSLIFGATLIVLYAGSTIYHSMRHPHRRRKAQVLDHAMIYVLIAGTYTPFTLVTLRGAWGWTLFGIVWGLAVIGVIREFFFKGKPKWLSMVMYLSMGWIAIIAIKPLIERLPAGGLWLLLSGGLAYTVGTIFYGMKKIPYTHAIWHLFVLGGSTCHFLAVALYVV